MKEVVFIKNSIRNHISLVRLHNQSTKVHAADAINRINLVHFVLLLTA